MAHRTAKEIAAKWKVDVRVVQEYCKNGRISGAQKYGTAWMIPEDAIKPEDRRRRKEDALPPLFPGLFVIGNVRFDGRSVEAIAAEFENSEYRRQFYGELAYLQGDIDKALALTEEAPKDDALSLCSLNLKNLACISKGDYSTFVANMRALDDMLSRYKARPQEAACIELAQAAVITSLYVVKNCPEWLKNSDFTNIPAEARLNTVYVHARYLHACGQKERMLGATEAALNLSGGKGITVTELYLCILRAIALVQMGHTLQAREILGEAFALAKPYRLYLPFSENMSSFLGELDAVLKESFPEDYKLVLKGWNAVYAGWAEIHNRILAANVPTQLTLKEYQIGLYLCWGRSHKEIASSMGLRPSTISNYVQAMRDKLGVATSAELIQRMRWI